MHKLNGKVAIVTGGSRGIGKGISLVLAKAGATVAVNYTHHEEAAQQVVDEIQQMKGSALAVKSNVANKEEVDSMVNHVYQAYGRIDILVNNAGVCEFKDFFDIDQQLWQDTLSTNLGGMFFCSQAVARYMKEAGCGSIVNISTVTTLKGGVEQVHYAASKGGVNSLTSSIANALGRYGIRVNAILCGGVITDINRHRVPQEMWVPRAKSQRLPLGRLGDPEDLGQAVLFLACEDSAWITGALLPVDGGWSVV